ncbi:hypothetical protein Ddye_010195 [Dipteronia dyeriana]|uniref:Uncharacterized protein n=1 Tax=Dipteronia dyeriana TaxID=168575 RepID=A0AAD9XDU5_9ROSI|nr:hypothetical protein Ddye_010195 [Dipteronia dyeriana]
MLMSTGFPDSLNVADLGCSSGPNTLLVLSEILDTIHVMCQQVNRISPEFQAFLNDLPGNDFNSIFKSLPTFYENLKKDKGDQFRPCFVSGMPGSFYERLFPSRSLHFIHSSYSLHWLSNGLVEATKVDSFNLPVYTPYEEEVREIVKKEGSFNLDKMEIVEVNWDPSDDLSNERFVFNMYESGKNVANCIRAVSETMLAIHFGESIIDILFTRYAHHVAHHLAVEKTKHINIVISMSKIN